MSNLEKRVEKIEERRALKHMRLPDMTISFIDAIHDADGRARLGHALPGRMLVPAFGNSTPTPYGKPCWIDEGGNPVPPPEWAKEPQEGMVRT